VRVVLTPRALERLAAIEDHVASFNPAAAERMVERLLRATRSLERFARRGRALPEAPEREYRELIVGSFRIVYRIRGDVVEVMTVFEGHRLLPPEELE
jgi:toxin ParE1/3/4